MVEKIFANVSCSTLEPSIDWYSRLFHRPPDTRPMAGLAEWHADRAGMQLFQSPENAGKSTLTLIVSSLMEEHTRALSEGLQPGEVEDGKRISLMRLHDPDGNLVVLAQPGQAR